MQKHEYFEELCAFAAIDQLSADECRQLLEHLQGCSSCKRTCDQFHLVIGQIPVPELSSQDEDWQNLHTESYRRRFLKRARAEGVRFTQEEFAECERRFRTPRSVPWPTYSLVAVAAVVMVTAAVLYSRFLDRATHRQTASNTSAVVGATVVRTGPPEGGVRAEGELILQLKQTNAETEERLDHQRQELSRAKAAYEQLQGQQQGWEDRAERLQGESVEAKQELVAARKEIERLNNEKNGLIANLVGQQARIKELSDEVQNQVATVERERQLTAAASDVRELMGARNLHIIDVADLDGHGKPRKSFGRVFYTEGKSLIFYAFDLNQKGSASKVAFQAWGQTPRGGNAVKNLGVFHIDDQLQKRWVLRVDNPDLIDSVESVFVTVEPAPGRDKPSGQKLLYAYLGTQPNHP